MANALSQLDVLRDRHALLSVDKEMLEAKVGEMAEKDQTRAKEHKQILAQLAEIRRAGVSGSGLSLGFGLSEEGGLWRCGCIVMCDLRLCVLLLYSFS